MSKPFSAIIGTHDLADDPPHPMSAVQRWTCTRCGRAVLDGRGFFYGSATTEPCREQR